jgi:DNA-binding transcriptional LysR family regulator
MHKTTLEQWSLLEKVVEAGSFAKAAEETHRSQSSVSYNLSLLQERLGVALLVPEGRRAVLTPAGELLLNQVKPLLKAFSYVETRAATLRNGCARGWIWSWTTFSRAAACSPFCASSSSSIRKPRYA